ncbi:MAG: hypothetical protein HYZ22_09015 [Chloroflexi bacterium]|nr:hypothetical protein [Chloroflexota bacterium]
MNKIVDDILEILGGNDLIQSTRIVNYDETPSGSMEAKLRSRLPKDHTLQVWIHIEPESLDYAYQLFTTVPLLRWDNSPHYEHLATAPHHFHDENGNVSESPLTGNIKRDLKIVLKEIADWIKSEESG